jgi:hypothetical protein
MAAYLRHFILYNYSRSILSNNAANVHPFLYFFGNFTIFVGANKKSTLCLVGKC